MTRKVLPLMILAGVVLLSSALAGCAKKANPQVALQRDIDNLHGKLEMMREREDQLAQENKALAEDLAAAKADLRNSETRITTRQETGPTGNGGATGAVSEIITVTGSVLFRSGSADLTRGGKQKLDGVANIINTRWSGHHISVEGHTDKTPLNKTKAKWKTLRWLSVNRARSVADHLIDRGVPKNLVSIVGHGDTRPTGGSLAEDRRVEIVVLAN